MIDETCTHDEAYRRNPHDEFTYWCPTCGFQWNTETEKERDDYGGYEDRSDGDTGGVQHGPSPELGDGRHPGTTAR